MADYLGRRPVNSTVYFTFTTHAATGAVVAPSSAFEAADLRIYYNGSGTQRSSANGITMTSPFGSVTGLHHVAIDLSDNTHASFYDVGRSYHVVLVPDETVDSLAVAKVLAYFEIGVPVVHALPVGAESAKDITLGQTVYFPIFTRNAVSGSETFKVWRDGNTTQRTSSSGITLTDSFDSNSSLNVIAVDTSDNTDAGFYRKGSHYMMFVEGLTADGHTFSTLHEFGIEYFHEPFRLKVGETMDNIQNGAADFTTDISSANNELVGQAIQLLDSTGQGRVIITSDHTTETVQTDADWTTNPAEDVRVKRFAGSPSYIEPGYTDITTESLEQSADKLLGRNIAGGSDGSTSVSEVLALVEDNVDAPISTVDTVVDAIKVKTDYLPSATAGAAGGVFIAGTNAATTVTTALTTTFTGNLTGSVASVTGAVGSVTGSVGGNVTGSVGSVTGAVGSVTGSVGGNVTGSVGSVAAGGITASSIAADAIGASELAADAVAEIADAVWDELLSGHAVSGSAGETLDNVATGTPPTAAAIADAVWDEATSGHTTSGTFGEQVKTDVDAIKTKTDSLTFTQANQVDANIQSINDVSITGDGDGTPWGPA
jgi:hypothetical protein